MQMLILIGIILVGFGVFLYLKKPAKKRPQRSKTTSPGPAVSPYLSVSIMSPRACCQAANDLIGSKFLVKNAPTLPLADCGQAGCRCGYIHHADRRDEDADRRALYGLRSELHSMHTGNERRERKGRRAADFAMA